MKKTLLILIIALVGLSPSSFANGNQENEERVRKEQRLQFRKVNKVFSERARLEKFTKKAIDRMVRVGLKELDRVDPELAQEKAFEWSLLRNADLNVLDLGDWDPMFVWLDDFYNQLEAKLGPKLMSLLKLTDIRVFNYATPITFNLYKMDSDTIDEAEYSYHFIPFAGATTYWTVRITCTIQGGSLCGFIAGLIRKKVEADLAPRWSDRFYPRYY